MFLAYATRHGHALIDRELHLPRSWAEDPQRCRAAGIRGEVEFTTKPRQAQAKGEAGLDHYQVRSWRAWYAHVTLSMLALAWLAASRAQAVKGDRRRRAGHDRLHLARAAAAAGQLDPVSRARPGGRMVLVTLAPTTPVPGPAVPLPAPRLCIHLAAPRPVMGA